MTRWWLGSTLALALAVGCGGSSEPAEEPADETGGAEAPVDEPAAERPSLSAEECEGQGGTVVGDIGDGATQRPDYVCPNGQPPLGAVPVGIEGSVCCGG